MDDNNKNKSYEAGGDSAENRSGCGIMSAAEGASCTLTNRHGYAENGAERIIVEAPESTRQRA